VIIFQGISTVLSCLQQLPQWQSTVVFITWDDSDGWYDQQMPPIIKHSQDPGHDALVGQLLRDEHPGCHGDKLATEAADDARHGRARLARVVKMWKSDSETAFPLLALRFANQMAQSF